ncbi:MAG: GTP-binding protein, partial [Planctomycetes bacterium]|nr:GTP-binding protein [Planctomycetota bacterium]
MEKTPKSLRLQLGLFGRTNVGKSSFLNMVAGQDVSITSAVAGTTTDVVEKSMELLPLGPVVFLDTGGFDDLSQLSKLRIEKGKKVFARADVIVLIVEANHWSKYEDDILKTAKENKTPFIIVVNKIDLAEPKDDFLEKIKAKTDKFLLCSSTNLAKRDDYVNILKQYLIDICPDDFLNPPSLIGDILPAGGMAVLIIPIDLEAPRG